MIRRPHAVWLADGRRLHLQDGPIDLIIEAEGAPHAVNAAYKAALRALTGLLDRLCAELPELRSPATRNMTTLRDPVARCMHAAVAPFADDAFITPMAAVAGSVAEFVLAAMASVADLQRAYVNNGGDIALYLAPGQSFDIGLIGRPDHPTLLGKTRIDHASPARGIATSGWRGRSFSLGIADAVTILARTAAMADAAATIVANAIDLPGHPLVERVAANSLQPDSDLGDRLVTCAVGTLGHDDVEVALDAGELIARDLLARGLIDGAALHLQGVTRAVGVHALNAVAPRITIRELVDA